MIDWLLAPVDASRAHDLSLWVSWHGRLMMLAWGVLCPLGILVARFCKILPRQDWPKQVDNRTWWFGHLALQYGAGLATLAGVWLILYRSGGGEAGSLHARIGWVVLSFAALQFFAGWLRGSKGGPSEPTLSGDHYDMSRRRLVFEYYHKFAGYALLLLALLSLVSGMWLANALNWMWIALGVWWALIITAFITLQKRGWAFDTYQAIWGPDTSHPGNKRDPIGWGVTRPSKER